MAELLAQFAAAWASTSGVEFVAALLAAAYLVLAIRQHAGCWFAAFVSSCLYVRVLFGAHLYMESALNGFYAAMALYGYWQWRSGAAGHGVRVVRWPLMRHGWGLLGVVALACVSSFFLRRFTAAALPFVDSLVTWSSVFATFLVARKVYENWHWWLVIDSLSLGLYVTRHLYLTALLFCVYLALIVVGMREWRAETAPAHVAR